MFSFVHQSESLTRTQHEREAEEHKELWEAEVRSRTKLGAKVRFVCFTNKEEILSGIKYALRTYFLCFLDCGNGKATGRSSSRNRRGTSSRMLELILFHYLCIYLGVFYCNLFVPM